MNLCVVMQEGSRWEWNEIDKISINTSWSPKDMAHDLTILRLMGFPGGTAGKESACNAGDLGLIPGVARSPGEGNSYPLQYSGLENSMDCVVHWVDPHSMGSQRVRHDWATFTFININNIMLLYFNCLQA